MNRSSQNNDDDDGGGGGRRAVRVVGSPKDGCRHCGAVKRAESGNVIVYTPATTCCVPALLDRIERRQAEIRTLRTALDRTESVTTRRLLLEALDDLADVREKLRRMEELN